MSGLPGLVLLAFLVGLSACRRPLASEAIAPEDAAQGAPIRLTLVATNDWHGWLLPQETTYPSGTIRSGGAATFAGYLKVLRDDNPHGVILLDAGDLFQGTLLANVTEGRAVVEAFNLLRFDAVAIGNHEFDYGPEGPLSAARPGLDSFGALKARIAEARFPFLSANISLQQNGERPEWLDAEGAIIVDRQGIKVGLFGLTTPQTPQVTLPINVASLRFAPLAPAAITAARRLRERGAHLVVAVVHAGGKCGSVANAHDLTSCDLDAGEIFSMMQGLPDGTLDAVIAGHTHAQIGHFVRGTPVIENWALGRYFGLIELFVDPIRKTVLKEKTRIRPAIELCETVDAALKTCDPRKLRRHEREVRPEPATFLRRPVLADSAITEALEIAHQQVAELERRPLGLSVPEPITRAYEQESALGSLVADSLRSLSKADVALMNPGGLRSDLNQGALTYRHVYEVLPFDNQLATAQLTGEELTRLVEAAYGAHKGVFQISGLEVRLSRCPTRNRLRQVSLPGGQSLNPKRLYRVVMPDFLARGGDGLGAVMATIDPARVDFGDGRGRTLRDELVEFWQTTKEAFRTPHRGRVTFLPDGDGCAGAATLNEHLGQP